jgi:hypothetical protein
MMQKIWGARSTKNEVIDKIVDHIAEAKQCEVEVADTPSNGANWQQRCTEGFVFAQLSLVWRAKMVTRCSRGLPTPYECGENKKGWDWRVYLLSAASEGFQGFSSEDSIAWQSSLWRRQAKQ